MMPKLVGIPYFNATERGARDAARELHVELDYNGPTDATAVHQVEFIQQWVQLRCDAITVAANDPDALAPALEEAQRAGVKTGSWDADVKKAARGYFVNQATFKAGRLGRVQIPNPGEVLLGKPLVFGKKTAGKYDF